MVETAVPRFPLYLVRHGATDLNMQRRFQGRRDEPLSESGRIQANDIGKRLSAILDEDERRGISLQSSPLKRALQTMETIAAQLGRATGDIGIADDLIEIGFGRWEGMTTLEVKAEYPQERRARKQDRWSFAPDGGESYASAADRFANWVSALKSPTLAVTHLGVMRAAAVVAGGHDRVSALRLDPGYNEIWLFSRQGLRRL